MRMVSTRRTVTGSTRKPHRLKIDEEFTAIDNGRRVLSSAVIDQKNLARAAPRTAVREGKIVQLRI